MKQFLKLSMCLLAIIILAGGCSKNNEETKDTEYPVIDLSVADAFPQQCGTVKRGQTFTFRARVTDNAELGSVSVDIHHNFDHHSHSTEVQTCQMGAVKTPVNPLLLIKSISIPTGLKTYNVVQSIDVPANADAGDYHFLIRLVDKAGWQTIKGISIKVE
ncbi:DUF4625 domain-containing protein [Mucilaginibacter aquatilis]|uniref:DUF4625 domain-containing protein n=1 Tax=Mucilaginibacter aquatilis TaxID=1517760 RepID=A0A6I4IQ50_9SPHI|nr:DUF4625 domain-containing protein [Mucilaginibacter aquatilis]MVN91113.1 DUF4625 domain-containing protein [Mucilaginibacter aquatilis]